MLEKTRLRRIIIDALLNQNSVVNDRGHKGLTLAGREVFDTPIELDSIKCGDKNNGLPAIAVYGGDEMLAVSDEANWDRFCFDQSQSVIAIELYLCASESHQLENLLDEFEEQVRFKLLLDPAFYEYKLRGYRSSTKRSAESLRLAVRTLLVTVQYQEMLKLNDQD